MPYRYAYTTVQRPWHCASHSAMAVVRTSFDAALQFVDVRCRRLLRDLHISVLAVRFVCQ